MPLTKAFMDRWKCLTDMERCLHLEQVEIEDVDGDKVMVWECFSQENLCCTCCRTMLPKDEWMSFEVGIIDRFLKSKDKVEKEKMTGCSKCLNAYPLKYIKCPVCGHFTTNHDGKLTYKPGEGVDPDKDKDAKEGK